MASSLGDQDDIDWHLLPNAAFDEIVASIMYGIAELLYAHYHANHSLCLLFKSRSVNPHATLLTLKTPLLKRERDGSTLLHLFAGGEHCDELIVFLLHAGIPVNVRVRIYVCTTRTQSQSSMRTHYSFLM